MTKVDLKDKYFTIPIHQSDRQFLRFSTGSQDIQFNCLPFGLSCAPWVFTKTLKPVLTLLKKLEVRLVAYIDDIQVLAETVEKAQDHTQALIYLLENLAYIVHPLKSVRQPIQEIEFLGMMVDFCTSNSSSSAILQGITERLDNSSGSEQPVLQHSLQPVISCQIGAGMVEHPANKLEWVGTCEGGVSGGGASDTNCSNMAVTAMVSQATKPASLQPAEDRSSTSGNNGGSSGSNSIPSRVAYLRQHYKDKKLSSKTSDLLLSSWRQKTSQSYDSLS
uniref:Reverse transcriptase domain-containing protein n=1 Tax=Amphimedon queenslandica TaxID=400682 RepID=A0A1X7TS08_AMPQE